MCGRYGLPPDHPDFLRGWSDLLVYKNLPFDELLRNFNIAPTQRVPVIFMQDGARVVSPMRWGMIPVWTQEIRGSSLIDRKGERMKSIYINGRSETIEKTQPFASAFKGKRRCLVPASGFFEWQKIKTDDGLKRVPHWITQKSRDYMNLAGLWSKWSSSEGDETLSCTILTTVPNSFMEPIHNRMPVILSEEAGDTWLSNSTSFAELKELLVPYDPGDMQAHVVSDLVNNVKNNGPELIEAVK